MSFLFVCLFVSIRFLPPSQDSSAPHAVIAHRPGGSPAPAGELHSSVGFVGLCMLRVDAVLNEAESFLLPALPEGTRLSTVDGRPLAWRPVPYAFADL